MEYNFKAESFEGPLDLLLHLIKEENIDIFDINISDITEQYLKYIKKMDDLNLNVDSEYLVLASELIELKSRELLPHEETIEEEDPKEQLINRLIEYQKFKEMSRVFQRLEKDRRELFTKVPSLLDEYKDDKVIIGDDVSLDDLLNAFIKFQEKKDFKKPLNTVVTKKEYSVHKRSQDIMNRLNIDNNINFEDLFEVFDKPYVVVTFLAILDLAKNGDLIINQDKNLDTIIISKREC